MAQNLKTILNKMIDKKFLEGIGLFHKYGDWFSDENGTLFDNKKGGVYKREVLVEKVVNFEGLKLSLKNHFPNKKKYFNLCEI